jgi:hypothetical protein
MEDEAKEIETIINKINKRDRIFSISMISGYIIIILCLLLSIFFRSLYILLFYYFICVGLFFYINYHFTINYLIITKKIHELETELFRNKNGNK